MALRFLLGVLVSLSWLLSRSHSNEPQAAAVVTREFIYEIGKWLAAGNAKKKDSLIQRAYEKGVPIFVPAFSDCSAGFGIVLIGTVAFSLLLAAQGAPLVIGHLGAYSPLIVALYLLAMRTVYQYERREVAKFIEDVAERYPHISLRRAAAGYAMAACVVVAAGIWLPFVGAEIAQAMGWHTSFVGTLLVAATTSAPEIAVTVAAVRMGALDMAVANLLGSNLFDILILAIDDLFYADGPLLAHVSPVHAVSAVSAIIMSGVAVVGLFYRPDGPLWRSVSWVSISLLALYLLNSYILFRHGT